ncbi:hypothetical protein BDB01DRAFT_772252 [Pilobolus umbonatus]|nr:hypothetical protein BDB01DRAFT_772252 [Pilobolus umbonatus]
MRRLWHRLSLVRSPARCIYCTSNRTELFPFNKTPSLTLGLLQSFSTHIIPTHNESIMRDHKDDCQLNSTNKINKASLLADFYRALSTQDIDRIWPLYTYIFNNNLLTYLTPQNFHSIFTYTVRNRTSQKNLHRLCALVDDMKARGISLQLSEYNALMDWVGGKTVPHRHPHHLTDALSIFEEMEKTSVTDEKGESRTKQPVKPSVFTFNILINIAAHLSDIRTAQKLYHDMLSREMKPDAYTYTPLFYAMSKMGDIDGMDHMLKDIQSTGFNINDNTIMWNVIMAGYAHNGLKEKAIAIFNGMDRDQLPSSCKKKGRSKPVADAESYRIYIDMMVRDGKLEQALETLDNMRKLGVKPVITIYNTLFASIMRPKNDLYAYEFENMDEIEKERRLKLLHELFKSLNDSHIKPNSDTMYTLVSAFLDLGDTKSALETFVFLSKNDSIPPSNKSLNRSVAHLAKERFLISKKDPSKIESTAELIDRLNDIVTKSVI